MSAGEVVLPGVRAQTPMGVLVAIGALDVLTERADAAARLSWRAADGGYCAVLRAGQATTVDELAALLLTSLKADPLDGLLEVAPDLNKVMPADLHDALSHPATARVLCGLCSEAPLRAKGQAAMTSLAITSFEGRRSVFPTIIRADASLSEKHLRAVLGGPWRYVPKVPTLNLDPAARDQDSARMAADASADGTRGVPGTLSLAARGLGLVPPLPSTGRRPRLGARSGNTFTWPVWTSPASRFGVRALMGRNWGERGRDEDVRSACGIVAVYAAEIIAVKDGHRLARARRWA